MAMVLIKFIIFLNIQNGQFVHRAVYKLTLGMFLSQFIEDIGGVKAGVVTKLAWDDLQGLGHGSNQQLFLTRYCTGIVPQVF